MRKAFSAVLMSAVALMADEKEQRREAVARIGEASKVFREIMAAEDKAIPKELLEKAKCVVIVPDMKRAGFIVGGQYGKGLMTCNNAVSGVSGWTGPSTVRIEGGSIGAQIGGGETDVVMVVMNDEGARNLMEDKFTIGGNAAAMAGPVGRSSSAQTNATLSAGILSYSRARGLFAGVTLNGSTLRPDNDDNRLLYGREASHKDILMGRVKTPAVARPLISTLQQYGVGRGEKMRTTPKSSMKSGSEGAKKGNS